MNGRLRYIYLCLLSACAPLTNYSQPTQWHTQPHHVQDAFPPASQASYVYSTEDVSQAHAYHIHQSYNDDRFFSPLEQYRHEEYSPSYSPTAPSYHSHIHAPIPISSYSTLLPHLENGLSECSSTLRQKDFDIYSAHDSASLSPSTSTSSQSRSLSPSEDVGPLETYSGAPQIFFPPPCELLATLAETDCLHTRLRHRTPSLPSYSKTRSASCGDIGGTGAPSSTRAQSSKGGKVRSSTSNACLKSSAVVRRSQRAASMSFVPDSQQKTRPENIRKVFFRTVQKFVGFKPTDP